MNKDKQDEHDVLSKFSFYGSVKIDTIGWLSLIPLHKVKGMSLLSSFVWD
jgi:hypothetical protein